MVEFTCSYEFDNHSWAVSVFATTHEEAEMKLRAMGQGTVDGVVMDKIPATDNPKINAALDRFSESDQQTLQLGMTYSEYERFVAWLKDSNRKEPEFAFTAGVLRTAARAVVQSGVLFR